MLPSQPVGLLLLVPVVKCCYFLNINGIFPKRIAQHPVCVPSGCLLKEYYNVLDFLA